MTHKPTLDARRSDILQFNMAEIRAYANDNYCGILEAFKAWKQEGPADKWLVDALENWAEIEERALTR